MTDIGVTAVLLIMVATMLWIVCKIQKACEKDADAEADRIQMINQITTQAIKLRSASFRCYGCGKFIKHGQDQWFSDSPYCHACYPPAKMLRQK